MSRRPGPWHREAAALVQTFAAGVAMALVSQIYNLPGKWTDLVFWWCVVSVPLAWVMKSNAVAIAYLVGIVVWAVAQVGERALPFTISESADLRALVPAAPRWHPGALARVRLARAADAGQPPRAGRLGLRGPARGRGFRGRGPAPA